MKTCLAFVVAVFLAASSAHAAPIVVNGDFESLSDEVGFYNGIALTDLVVPLWDVYVTLPGWNTVSGEGIEVHSNMVVTAHSGTHYVELDSGENSGMEQTLTGLDAGNYVVSFWYRPRTIHEDDNTINVLFDGIIVGVADGTSRHQNFWQQYAFPIAVGATGDHSLVFAAAGDSNSYGGFVDDIALETAPSDPTPIANPEPASLVLLGSGVVAVFRYSRRRN